MFNDYKVILLNAFYSQANVNSSEVAKFEILKTGYVCEYVLFLK